MKRWLALAVACMIVLSGCTEKGTEPPVRPDAPEPPSPAVPGPEVVEPEPEESPELAQLRADMKESGDLFAVAHLAGTELPDFTDVSVYLEAEGFGERYPFLYEIPEERLVRQEGIQIYAVVPASADVTLRVYSFGFEEGAEIPEPGELLMQITDGKPFLLIGNISDIVPNLYIEAERDGTKVLEYNPCISMMDGSLVVEEGVYDFTPYDLLATMWPGYDPLPDMVFTGTHYTRKRHINGDEMALILTLENDGTAEYKYGYPESELLEYYTGTWNLTDDDRIVLELSGGELDWETGEHVGDEYSFRGVYRWDVYGSELMLELEEGTSLMPAGEDSSYHFMYFDSFRLAGTWVASTDWRDWVYELKLWENGECQFVLFDTAGNDLVWYEGWWYEEEGLLSLSMLHSDGEHPENPEIEYVSGYYVAEMTAEDQMKLTFDSGSILTLDMEASTEEEFVRMYDAAG